MKHVQRDYEACKETEESRIFEVEKSMSDKKSLFNHFFIGRFNSINSPRNGSPQPPKNYELCKLSEIRIDVPSVGYSRKFIRCLRNDYRLLLLGG